MIYVGAGQLVAILIGLMLLAFLAGALLAPAFWGKRHKR